MITLRFVSGGGWDSKVIKQFTRCQWSHVEAMPGVDVTFGAMLSGGVKFRFTTDSQYNGAIATKLIPIPCTEDQATKFWNFLHAQAGKPYDWKAIASFSMGQRDWRCEDSWFCSELQARALEVAGLITLPQDLPVDRITPRDIWMVVAPLLGDLHAVRSGFSQMESGGTALGQQAGPSSPQPEAG